MFEKRLPVRRRQQNDYRVQVQIKTKDIRLDKREKSLVAENSIETGHGIDFSRTHY